MSTTPSRLNDVALFMIRVMLGIAFMFHGSQKLFGLFGGSGIQGFAGYLEKMNMPAPQVGAVLAGAAEFFGGLAVLIGLGVRLAVIPMVFTMLVASFVAHEGKFPEMEHPLTLAVVLTALGLMGGGRCSLGHFLSSKRRSVDRPSS